MLASHALPHSRPWSRGVDLSHFNPSRRSSSLRRHWGIDSVEALGQKEDKTTMSLGARPHHIVGGLATPPMSPEFGAADAQVAPAPPLKDSRLAVLYVGRV